MITIKTEIEIEAPIQLCFDYARDINLHTKTVWHHTKEQAIAGITDGRIGVNEWVTFEAPFGFVGLIVEKILLKRYMKKFLQDRNKQLKKLIEEKVNVYQEVTNFR